MLKKSTCLLVLILLFTATAAEPFAATPVSNYQPVFEPFHGEDGTVLAAVRRFRRGSETLCLVIDPSQFEFRIMASEKAVSAKNATEEAWRGTPFYRALSRYTAPPLPLQNAGLREGEHPAKGVFLTADLCPSKKPLDRTFIQATLALTPKRPIPIALMVTGLWITRHEADLSWLTEQADAKRLEITWVNHSFSHDYNPTAPLEKNFLLRPGTDFTREVLSLETLLLERGLLPSPFFRFPGLVSDGKLIERLRGLSLIPVGSNAWLAKGEEPKAGSVILVHGNGNEPEGIRRLLSFYKSQQEAFLRKETSLLPLRDALTR